LGNFIPNSLKRLSILAPSKVHGKDTSCKNDGAKPDVLEILDQSTNKEGAKTVGDNVRPVSNPAMRTDLFFECQRSSEIVVF